MKKLKQICKVLLFPPIWLMILLVPACTWALVKVFADGITESPFAYAAYVVSFYTLTVVCIFLGMVLPGKYRTIHSKICSTCLGYRYMTDPAFKVRVSLYNALAINLIYSVVKLTFGVVYHSFWLGAVAVYYMVLAMLRFLLLRFFHAEEDRQSLLHEWQRYLLTGALLMVLNLTLTGIVFQMVWQNQGHSYPGTMIYAAAAYTFYCVGSSIVDLIKYRKYESPVLSASKAIRFAAAMVSLLSLETAMLVQFGEDERFRMIMTAATGAGVCILVLNMSGCMIVRANKEMKKLKEFN